MPEPALDYAYDLWQLYKFNFKVSSARKTKLGDFRADSCGKLQVTVNHNLNPYQFLITYLHEVAHVITWLKHGRKAQPHGQEWKNNFTTLLQPVLKADCFPADVLPALKLYAANPAATLAKATLLSIALQKYNTNRGNVETTPLIKLKPGDVFKFQDCAYKHISRRRTRILCEHLETGRKYLIPQVAEVELA